MKKGYQKVYSIQYVEGLLNKLLQISGLEILVGVMTSSGAHSSRPLATFPGAFATSIRGAYHESYPEGTTTCENHHGLQLKIRYLHFFSFVYLCADDYFRFPTVLKILNAVR